MKRSFLFSLLISSAVSAAPSDCKYGHSIEAVSDDGARVTLEDGSIWEVQALDRVSSVLWLPSMSVGVCKGKLTNTEMGESVSASRMMEIP